MGGDKRAGKEPLRLGHILFGSPPQLLRDKMVQEGERLINLENLAASIQREGLLHQGHVLFEVGELKGPLLQVHILGKGELVDHLAHLGGIRPQLPNELGDRRNDPAFGFNTCERKVSASKKKKNKKVTAMQTNVGAL